MVTKDIMTTRVVTVTPETGVRETARLLLTHHISAVPVLNADGRLVGLVREGDLMHRVETGTERHHSRWPAFLAGPEELARDYVKSHGMVARDVMSLDIVSVRPETPVDEVADLLEKRHLRSVPVVSEGKVVGMVSRPNLLRALAAPRAQPEASPPANDEAIRQRVVQVLRSADWVHFAYVYPDNVIVTDGVVELWGLVNSEAEEQAACVAARGVPGVRAVEDHLAKIPAWALAE